MRMTPAVAAMVGSFLLAPRMDVPLHRLVAPKDACALLTQAEVSAELGIQMGPGAHIVKGFPLQCSWRLPGQTGDVPTGKFVMLAIETTMRFQYETQPMKGRITQSLPGVGDEAVYVGTAGFSPALSVKKGDAAFQIHVLGFPDAQVKAKEKALALKAVSRL